MNPSGSSKKLDYEASAGWTTYGTWRAPFSLFQCPREGSSSMTGGAGLRPLHYRILDFGHARFVILRDVALPIQFAVRAGDRVAVRLDPRPRRAVSPLAGFITALMNNAGDGESRQFIDLHPPVSLRRLAQKENGFAIYASLLVRAG